MAVMAVATAAEINKNLILAGAKKNLPMNIVLVDDSTVVHRMLGHRFKILNWKMVSLYNGQEAINMYEKTGFKGIDIILMDKDMPIMTGDTATEKLVEMGCDTPIVALTACPDSLDEFVARGAMGVLNKPLQIPNLLQTILRTRSLKVETEKQKKTQTAQPSSTKEDEMISSSPNVENWTQDDVCLWLPCLGNAYKMYGTAFQYHGITGKALLLMDSPENFETLGVTADLHRKRLHTGIQKLKDHMAEFRDQAGDKTLLEPLAADDGHETLELNDQDFVENLYDRCTGEEFSDAIFDIVSKSFSRLTEDAKQKIRILVNDPDVSCE